MRRTGLDFKGAVEPSCGVPRLPTDKGARDPQLELACQVYKRLSEINESFESILANVEMLREMVLFRKGSNGLQLKSCRRETREACARINFEVLEVLLEQAEREWTRLGRQSSGRN